MFLRFVVSPLVAAELDKYTAVFSSNLKFPGLFVSPKCCHTVAFPFVLTTIINSLGAPILNFVTRPLLYFLKNNKFSPIENIVILLNNLFGFVIYFMYHDKKSDKKYVFDQMHATFLGHTGKRTNGSK